MQKTNMTRHDGRRRRPARLAVAVSLAMGLSAPAYAQIYGAGAFHDDAAVRAVLDMRSRGIEAMTSGNMSAETERYTSTFVANTPSNRVVPGEALLELFASGNISYERVEQHVEYAASHGPDVVVIMGEEIVVPGAGAPNAGERIVRRFTDVFRREAGEWRHDLRHAHVVRTED